jgi:hypothetical protein
MSQMPFFKTLHEETRPVGSFGRGAHYSVMRAPIWQDKWLKPMPNGAMLDFAIIWDEDHDERVLEVIEQLYFAGLLAPVRFIGERKGSLSVLIDAEAERLWKAAALKHYHEAVNRISNGQDDPWPAQVASVASHINSHGTFAPLIIHEDCSKVATYLRHIDLLWSVGIKPHQVQVMIEDFAPEQEDPDDETIPF